MEGGRQESLKHATDYIKQLAWLHAAPDTKYEAPKHSKSRWEEMERNGLKPEFPDCAHAYLIEHLTNMGFSCVTGMGEAPLTHAEIAAYQSNMGLSFQPWEVMEIRRLSQLYISHGRKSENPAEPMPYISFEERQSQERRNAIDKGIHKLFQSRNVKASK